MTTETSNTTTGDAATLFRVDDDLARTYREQGLWRTDETILDDLARAAAAHPDRTAISCWRSAGGDPDVVTYAELAARVERIAAGLAGLGVRRGQVVTVQLPNCWEFVATCLACARIGAIAGPTLPIMRRRELTFMTGLTESPVYIGPVAHRGYNHAELSRQVTADVPGLRHRVLVGAADADPATDGLEGSLDFATTLLADPGEPGAVHADLDMPPAGADDLAYVMFTSGTTGEPKGVVHSHNTLYATCLMQAEVLGLGPDEVTAMGSPNAHNAGYTWNVAMPLVLGGTSHHVDHWDAELMLRILEQERVTFFMGAPPFLVDLIGRQRERQRDLTALRTFATGSAPIPPVLVEQARDVLGCRLYALWGMTENGCVTVTRPEDPPMRAAESDGSVVPGMRVRVVDDGGEPVAAGGTGRLQVRGANQCLGYHRRPAVYTDSLVDGWFDTGDLARDDGYGGIRIAGREKDVISRGGEKIPVVEVEAALLRHPQVHDVAVVGYPDDRLGERGCAVVVAPQGSDAPDLGDIREHLDALGMAKQYWPERVEPVSDLPRTPGGKVQKFKLRERLAQG